MSITITHGKRERFNFKGATYHIITRCNAQQNLITNDVDFNKFISILKKCKEKHGFLLYNYVLMNNHVHLAIQLEGTLNISTIMHSINRWYARWYNEHYKRKGHFWEDRFYGELIKDDFQLLAVLRYIDTNPIRAKLCDNPSGWKYSGAKFYLCGIQNNLIDIPSCYLELAKSWELRREAYKNILAVTW
ncbi:MAG: transposase [Candidatus Omnitrophica bacterium]|nr:transposase [Candidatus Omnitrophota bacterium]